MGIMQQVIHVLFRSGSKSSTLGTNTSRFGSGPSTPERKSYSAGAAAMKIPIQAVPDNANQECPISLILIATLFLFFLFNASLLSICIARIVRDEPRRIEFVV